MKHSVPILLVLIVLLDTDPLSGQQAMPEILQTGTLREQLDYIQERTLIYNNFRAIREDMFQRVRNNSLDSLANVKGTVDELSAELNGMKRDIDSLSSLLESSRSELRFAVRDRDSIAFLGIPMHKTGYNLIVWFIIAGLATLLILGFLAFTRNRLVTSNVQHEIEDLKREFEDYRKRSREKREQLVIEHFNEIKKLKQS